MEGEVIVQEASSAVPVDDAVVSAPNPISTNPGAGDKPEAREPVSSAPEKPKSVRESLEAAARKAEANEPAEGEKGKTLPGAPNRDATGKFAGKTDEAQPAKGEPAKVDPATPKEPHADPPQRFSNDAKAAWATAPEPVRAEAHRAIRELEQGVTKYKGDSDAYQAFKPFHDLAKQLNVDPSRTLEEYVGIDRTLGEDFNKGMARICQNKGVDVREFAADVLNLPPEARQALGLGQAQRQQGSQQSQPSAEVLELRRQVAELTNAVGGIVQTSHDTARANVDRELQTFVATNPPLFDELSDQIAAHITNNGLSLPEAHAKAYGDFQAMAQRAGLIPHSAATTETADLTAQTQKGQKSIAGAPGAGSAPVTQQPSTSIREALRRALQSA